MNMHMKQWLIVAIILIIVGLAAFAAAMSVNHWDFSKFSNVQPENNVYSFTTPVQSIRIGSQTADIAFVPAEDDACKVVCEEAERIKHSVSLNGSELSIQLNDDRKWYEQIGISIFIPKITVYLPEREYGALSISETTGSINLPEDFRFESIRISATTGNIHCQSSATDMLSIQTTTGNICAEKLYAASIELQLTTGDVSLEAIDCSGELSLATTTGKASLSDLRCGSLASTGTTGSISLKNTVAEGMLSVERSTGSVALDGSDAGEIRIKTTTGSVTGSLLSGKLFTAKATTGSVSVPESTSGGKCDIQTTTGNIRIEIQ